MPSYGRERVNLISSYYSLAYQLDLKEEVNYMHTYKINFNSSLVYLNYTYATMNDTRVSGHACTQTTHD